MRFNPPPGWPAPPEGFAPDPGWQPDPSWPPLPPGWQLWVPGDQEEDAASGLTTGYAAYGAQPPAGSPWDTPPAPGPQGYTFPQAPAWGPPAAPPPSGASGLAIAAFVLGLLGAAVITAIAGIVLGIVSLSRIRRSGGGGKGFSIAGIALGGAWLLLPVALGVVVATSSGSAPQVPASAPVMPPPSSAAMPSPGAGSQTVSPFSLVTGDCFENPRATADQTQIMTSVVQTPCDKPHNAQIFATFNVSGSILSYPGDAKLRSIAGSGCAARVKTSLNRAKVTDSMTIRFLIPIESSWLGGHRTVSCIVYNPAPTVTSSLMNS